jgi:hypothetical protein
MGNEVLCIGLLRAFSISAGESVIADDAWRLRKAKTLIKLLALAPEHRLHVDRAAELLWLISTDVHRKRLDRRPVYVAGASCTDAGPTEVQDSAMR